MFFVMKWSDRFKDINDPEKQGKFAILDKTTRFYPLVATSFAEATIVTDIETVKHYKNMYPELDVYELSIGLEPAHL